MTVSIGIDVGGTKIAAGVVDEDGRIVARNAIETASESENAVVVGITKIAQEMKAAAPGAVAVGVGAAGLVDFSRGVVRSAPNIAWTDVHLRALLQDRLSMPVVVDNDANVAAWGEALYGAGRGVLDMAMVTVGTGIGGGLVLRGALYRGATGVGAEIGHMIVAEGGAECPCGNRGCFEAMASGNSIGRRAREAGRDLTGEQVGEAARRQEKWAVDIVAETGMWLGVGLASLANLLDPELIVIGGGAGTGLGELLLAPARDALAERLIGRSWRAPPEVVPARLGYAAGIVGAAALAREVGGRGDRQRPLDA